MNNNNEVDVLRVAVEKMMAAIAAKLLDEGNLERRNYRAIPSLPILDCQFTVNAQFRDFSFVVGDHLCGTKHRIGVAGYFSIHSRLLVQRRPSLVQASQSWAQLRILGGGGCVGVPVGGGVGGPITPGIFWVLD
jgi:hypothetical protein